MILWGVWYRVPMTYPNSPQPPVSTREVAKATGSCPSFFYRHKHEIPGRYRVGRCFRWDVAVVRAWMRQQATAKDK